MRRFSLPAIVLLLVFAASGIHAQDAPATDVYPLSLSSGASLRIFPSPNARLVAYDSAIRLNGHVDRYLTISEVAPADEPAYFDKPEDLPRGFEASTESFSLPFAWSPDSTRLAVTSQPLVTLTDTDLWIFDIAAESWTNLVDDGYSGSLTESPTSGTIIDVQPAWSPDGTTIAVERTLITADGTFGQPEITLLDATTGAATPLAALPGAISTGAITSLGWSPDGASLAFTMLHLTPDAANDGLWLVDAASGELTQLATLEQVAAALHTIIADLEMTSIGPLFWSPDSTRLLLWAGKASGTPAQLFPFVADAAFGEITPVPLPAHPRDSETARGLRPLQAAWSPDSASVLVYTFGLHPDEDSTSLDPANASVRGAVRLIDLATGDAELIGYLPLGTTPFYYASWAADGEVIIDGYHLTLGS
ncbi:MAG: PD40 domain-containing protein [Anaerolineae bacterium]|nr:PD40 domain-containing protein [Anaerolineae bacterium]